MSEAAPRVLILGVGNTARGDDALAPLLLQRLRASAHAEQHWLTLLEDAQLQIEHALDVQTSDLTLFIDASVTTAAPWSFREISAPAGHRIMPMSHALQPADILHTIATIGRRSMPPCFLLAIRGERFELGDGLSEGASRHLEDATRLLDSLLQQPDVAAWRARTTADSAD